MFIFQDSQLRIHILVSRFDRLAKKYIRQLDVHFVTWYSWNVDDDGDDGDDDDGDDDGRKIVYLHVCL